MNKLTKYFICAACLLSLISCASKQTSYVYDDEDVDIYDLSENEKLVEAPVMTDDFLGDLDPVLVKKTMVLTKASKGMKPLELANTYLFPRYNTLEFTFRYGVNNINFTLNKTERNKLAKTMEQFLADYEAKVLPRHKVKAKNAYYNSNCTLRFGVASFNYVADECKYWTNCEIIDKHAYFLLHFSRTETRNGQEYTPQVNLYLSPSQIRDFLEILDQEYLNTQVQELRTKAYTYD